MTRRRSGTTFWLPLLLDDERLDATETLLLIGLADHVNEDDEAWPSIETLASRARCSYVTARRRLAALEQRGVITRRRRRREGGNLSTYAYRLVRSEAPALNLSDGKRSPRGAMASALPGERAEPDQGEPDQSEEPTTDQPSLPLGLARDGQNPADTSEWDRAVADSFVTFWAVYPYRRGARAAAERAWRAALKLAPPSVLLDGVRRYAADPNLPPEAEARFVPHASTWLSQRRWEDGPLPPRGQAKRTSGDVNGEHITRERTEEGTKRWTPKHPQDQAAG
jgi:hypothetical protein